MPSVKLTQRSNPKTNLKALKEQLQKLTRTEVVVGWPAAASSRSGEDVTNAELAFIHQNGSPLKNIPARPILPQAIQVPEVQEQLANQLAKVTALALQKKTEQARQQLERAGVMATNAVKRWFVNPSNGWAPNAPSTILQKGSSKPLIDSGQLRRAVTYVVREVGDGAQAVEPDNSAA